MNNVNDEYILYFKPDTLITSLLVGEATKKKKGEQTYLKEQLKKKRKCFYGWSAAPEQTQVTSAHELFI